METISYGSEGGSAITAMAMTKVSLRNRYTSPSSEACDLLAA